MKENSFEMLNSIKDIKSSLDNLNKEKKACIIF